MHSGYRVDPLHAARGAEGPHLDGKGRRPLSLPDVSTPGYRHTVGVARSWHFITVYGFVLTGVFFVIGLLTSTQWERLVPGSSGASNQPWGTFVHYANFHFPPEPNGFYGYNALQQLAYFATVFVMAPLSILTGMAMSPALVNRFPPYTKLFRGRQGARSIHFLVLVGFIGFIVVHVTLIALTGFPRNMNHIVLGTDDLRPTGMILGLWDRVGVAFLDFCALHIVDLPTGASACTKGVDSSLMLLTLDQLLPREHYTAKDISLHFWPNGKYPYARIGSSWLRRISRATNSRSRAWSRIPQNYRWTICAHSEWERDITMHHCIQGWSGIAQWGGVSMRKLMVHAKPLPQPWGCGVLFFRRLLDGDLYYDTQTIFNALKPECLLALTTDGSPLPAEYGAPLRLRGGEPAGLEDNEVD